MRSRASSLLLAGVFVSASSFLACASNTEDDGGPVVTCEPNPESAIQPKAGYLNAGYLNGDHLNGDNLNAGYLNAGYVNGGYVNGGYINAGFINGVQLEGVAWDGGANGTQIRVGATIPAVLADGRSVDLRVTSFERSPDGARADYVLEYEGQNVCGDGVTGMFVPGVWDEKAARHDAMTIGDKKITATFACAGGVIAKCVVWGYAPWKVGADLHQTCTRLARADYCGSGVSFTKNGTFVDVYDARGIQSPITDDATLAFEAGWGPNGAVCVNRTRYDAHDTAGASVMPGCWASLPRCSSFQDAKAQGATIGNSSRIQSRTFCGDGVERAQATGQPIQKPMTVNPSSRCDKAPSTDGRVREGECRDMNTAVR